MSKGQSLRWQHVQERTSWLCHFRPTLLVVFGCVIVGKSAKWENGKNGRAGGGRNGSRTGARQTLVYGRKSWRGALYHQCAYCWHPHHDRSGFWWCLHVLEIPLCDGIFSSVIISWSWRQQHSLQSLYVLNTGALTQHEVYDDIFCMRPNPDGICAFSVGILSCDKLVWCIWLLRHTLHRYVLGNVLY